MLRRRHVEECVNAALDRSAGIYSLHTIDTPIYTNIIIITAPIIVSLTIPLPAKVLPPVTTDNRDVGESPISMRKLQDEFRRYLANRPLSHFITLTTNEDRNSRYMQKKIDQWFRRINRRMLGTRWQKKPDEWMIGFFFCEKVGLNAHWHGLISLLEEQYDLFETKLPDVWNELVPSGNTDIQRIGPTEKDKIAVSNYSTKLIKSFENYDNFYIGKFNPTR
jgi:hypothetical protein